MVGYVLKDDGGWTSVLLEEERLVVMLPSEDVVARELCDTADVERRIIELWTDVPDYEPCGGGFTFQP
jgi:hypothetical protein